MARKKFEPVYTKEEYKFDLLYAFPKYRALLVDLDNLLNEKIKLENNIKYYEKNDIENKLIIKQKNRTIFKLRKELKELKNEDKFF